jgi:hypothetical protein
MQFQELVRLRNQIKNLDLEDLRTCIDQKYEKIKLETDVPLAGIDQQFVSQLNLHHDNLINLVVDYAACLQELKDQIQNTVNKESVAWFQRSYDHYQQQLETKHYQSPDAVNWHKNKSIELSPELSGLFHSRVASNCDWRYPAMIIHPMTESFIDHMVGSDPLYLIDESHHLLDLTLERFNPVYKARVRPYVIEESFDQPILQRLPDQQFGYCLAYNYFHYRPFELIKVYLSEIFAKLMPGGILAMTFIDADKHQSLASVEQYVTCYTPGSLIRSWAEYVGFEEVYHFEDEGSMVWVELKKPGTRFSLRGGQALAKILPKPVANSK